MGGFYKKNQIKSNFFRDLLVPNLTKIDWKYLRYNILSLVIILIQNLIKATTLVKKQNNKICLVRVLNFFGNIGFYLMKNFQNRD